jgi:XTP/dITP diphosphohydrolase
LKRIIFATGNNGKLKEVQQIFEGTKFQIVPMSELANIPEIEEDGDTFEDNALKKAKFIFNKFGLPTIEQLGGRPGVYSARYAGENCTFEDNNKKVLEELKDFPAPHKAQFLSYAIYFDGRNIHSAIGKLPGEIINEIRGDKGFGYDPIFVPEGFNITLAEMELEEKNKISHRAKAFNELKQILLTTEV